MLFFLKKLFFKFMELGLGLRPCFSLETKNPVFINFKLTPLEVKAVQESLPKSFTLQPIRFSTEDSEAHYWVSYNLYEIKYPKKELEHLKKVRCEINTFVTDSSGRKGVFVFCGSPYVSKEEDLKPLSLIADFAERLVIWIYGVGRLLKLEYRLKDNALHVKLNEKNHALDFRVDLKNSPPSQKLSSDYWRYNDISFFNEGRSYDLVNTNSQFTLAEFSALPSETLKQIRVGGPFFERSPDALLYHEGAISYLVAAMNKMSPLEARFE